MLTDDDVHMEALPDYASRHVSDLAGKLNQETHPLAAILVE